MKLIKMSYKGVDFEVNPTSLEISFEKKMGVNSLPFSSSKVQEINILPEKITGKGKLVGDNAREKAYQLELAFKSKGSAYLFVPNANPIKAFFSSLTMSYDAKDDSVNYSFEFTEDSRARNDKYDFGFIYSNKSETIFDISYRTGVPVEKLVGANSLKDVLSIPKGTKIWLN